MGPAGRHRQQDRRQRQYRDRDRGPVRSRRPHGSDDVNPTLFKSVPYDPIKSFTPVIKLATGSIVLAVHPSVPVDTTSAFVRYAKARPGQVNYGSPGFGTPHHLAMELF